MSKDYLQHFADIIIREAALSVEQWTVKIITSGGGLLVRPSLEIWIDEAHVSHPYMLLHELAHIKYPEHDVFWGDLFTALCADYADIWNCLPGRGIKVLVDRNNPRAQCWQVWPDENGDHELVALKEIGGGDE